MPTARRRVPIALPSLTTCSTETDGARWGLIPLPKKTVWVDAGAAEALLDHGKSLLISGVTKAEGDFSYHDIVSVYHQETGQLLGKGKVRLGQSAVRDLLQSKKARGILIHRDDWISVTPEIDLLFTEF